MVARGLDVEWLVHHCYFIKKTTLKWLLWPSPLYRWVKIKVATKAMVHISCYLTPSSGSNDNCCAMSLISLVREKVLFQFFCLSVCLSTREVLIPWSIGSGPPLFSGKDKAERNPLTPAADSTPNRSDRDRGPWSVCLGMVMEGCFVCLEFRKWKHRPLLLFCRAV